MNVRLHPEGWSHAMHRDLDRVAADRPALWYREEIRVGRAHGLGAWGDGGRLGTVVYRVDGREWVCMAAAGSARGVDLVAKVLPGFDDLARAAGCASVRFHTRRPGLLRRAPAYGFAVAEVVLRKAVDHGRQ